MIMCRRITLFLILFVALNGLGCAAKRGYDEARRHGDEELLRVNLSSFREVIREYTAATGKPPQRLSDLVTAGYMNAIPVDPMTNKADWIVVEYDCGVQTKCLKGIRDVHSASKAASIGGTPYSEW
jgi:general secretion pathway protein G